MTIPDPAELGEYGHIQDHNDIADILTAQVAINADHEARLDATPVHSVITYGAVGDFDADSETGTDSTAAFQAAIDYIANLPATSRPALEVPAGCYEISEPLTGIPRNLRIVGSGKAATRICYTGTGVMFDLGVYATSGTWTNTASGFCLEQMWVDVPNTDYTSEGSRPATCIRDNGSGNVTLTDTKIAGFAYGFTGYGSDFTVFNNADFLYNDVGVYFGPGCEQIVLNSGMFLGNAEALVLERTPQGTAIGTSFIDSSIADIVAEYTTGSTRCGNTSQPGIKHYKWVFNSCWYESDADASGDRIVPQHILSTGDDSSYPQYLTVKDAYLVSGGPSSASNAFWRCDTGTRHALDGLLIYGDEIEYVVDLGTSATTFLSRNIRETDGTPAITRYTGAAGPPQGEYDDTNRLAVLEDVQALYSPALAPALRKQNRGQPTIVTSFQTGHAWTTNDGSPAATWTANDVSDFTFGSQCASVVTAGNASSSPRIQKLAMTNMDLTGRDLILWVKISDTTHLKQMHVLAGNATLANYFQTYLHDDTIQTSEAIDQLKSNEWMMVRFPFGADVGAGAPSKTTITDLRVTVIDDGTSISVKIGAIGHAPSQTAFPNGVVSVCFDDGYASVFTRGNAKMSQLGFPATFYAIADRTDIAGGLSTAQLRELHDVHGWDIAGHAYTTASHTALLTNLTSDELEEDLLNMKSWLLERGYRGSDHFAYPGGYHNAAVTAQTSKYFVTGRGVINQPRGSTIPSMPMRLPAIAIAASTSTASITAAIDKAYTEGAWLSLIFHDIVASGAVGGTQYNVADFNTVMDYLVTKGIPVRTVDDVWRSGA